MQRVELDDCCIDGSQRFSVAEAPTSAHIDKDIRAEVEVATEANTQLMADLQDKLYAEGREGVVVLIQAMDAAGKDSTVKHVMSGVNPQGVEVTSFKQPSSLELSHDYLWRAVLALPERGRIGIFNRSYYEDVLIVRVHELQKGYRMPKRCVDMGKDEFFARRYKQIANFEEYLWENGYRVIKIFLNESLEEQKKRFLDRIENPAKNWKFSAADLKERALWPVYMDAYEKAINATATKHAPWYAIPADQKWYARWLVSEAIVKTLQEIDPRYPELSDKQKVDLLECTRQLLGKP